MERIAGTWFDDVLIVSNNLSGPWHWGIKKADGILWLVNTITHECERSPYYDRDRTDAMLAVRNLLISLE